MQLWPQLDVPAFVGAILVIAGLALILWGLYSFKQQRNLQDGYSKQEIQLIESRTKQKQSESRRLHGYTISWHKSWIEAKGELEDEGRITRRDHFSNPPKGS
jgi:hypothetical protein